MITSIIYKETYLIFSLLFKILGKNKSKTMRTCNQMSLYVNIPKNKRRIQLKLNTIVHICGTLSIKLKKQKISKLFVLCSGLMNLDLGSHDSK